MRTNKIIQQVELKQATLKIPKNDFPMYHSEVTNHAIFSGKVELASPITPNVQNSFPDNVEIGSRTNSRNGSPLQSSMKSPIKKVTRSVSFNIIHEADIPSFEMNEQAANLKSNEKEELERDAAKLKTSPQKPVSDSENNHQPKKSKKIYIKSLKPPSPLKFIRNDPHEIAKNKKMKEIAEMRNFLNDCPSIKN